MISRTMDGKNARCIICDAQNAEIRFTMSMFKKEYSILRCKTCGHEYRWPMLSSEDELKNLYVNDYLESYDATNPEAIYNTLMQKSNDRLNFVKKYCESKKGRMLEIGCSAGTFLSLMKNSGWEVQGVEPYPPFCDYAKKTLNIPVFCGMFEHASFPPNYFDIIVMWQTLEHFSNLPAILKTISQILKDDGLVFIEVPNIDDLWKYNHRSRIYEYTHTNFFSPKTLAELLNQEFMLIDLVTYSDIELPFDNLNRLANEISRSNKRYQPFKKLLSLLHFNIMNLINTGAEKFNKGANIRVVCKKR